MKIYKYKDISNHDAQTLEQLYQIILRKQVWCSSPDKLNDNEEFLFEVDYTPTAHTARLLTQILIHHRHTPVEKALSLALHHTNNGTLKEHAMPIIENLKATIRSSLGISCFSTLKNDPVLWDRYGGKGNGVCVEIDVPDSLMDTKLFRVTYVSKKVIHVDSILESSLPSSSAWDMFKSMLLTKTEARWKAEKEVRFITHRQNVLMSIDGATVTDVMFGNKVESRVKSTILEKISRAPHDERGGIGGA